LSLDVGRNIMPISAERLQYWADMEARQRSHHDTDAATWPQRPKLRPRRTPQSMTMTALIRNSLGQHGCGRVLNATEEAQFRAAYVSLIESSSAREQLIAVAHELRGEAGTPSLPTPTAQSDGGVGLRGELGFLARVEAAEQRDGPVLYAQALASAPATAELAASLPAATSPKACAAAGPPKKWYIQADERLHSFGRDDVVTLGLPGYGNDIELPHGSRMHAIVLPFQDRLCVVDVGGKFGFRITERSTRERDALAPSRDLAQDRSAPGARRVLLVEEDETAVLQLTGALSVVVNPKTCVVCLDEPRRVVFAQCNHFVCCQSCAARLHEDPSPERRRCPTCREPIGTRAVPALHALSNAAAQGGSSVA